MKTVMGPLPIARWSTARRFVARVEAWVVRAEETVAVGLVVAIVVAVLVQVVMRYVFASPNSWTEELSRFAFIWLSLVGAALATRGRAHFALESVVAYLSPAVRTLVASVVTLMVSTLLVGIVVAGTALAIEARLERSPALDLPMAWVYSALPLAAALMLLHIAARAVAPEPEEGAWASR